MSLAAGKKNEDGLTGRNSEVKRKTSVLERATANNGMSMDHHAAHEGANSFRQQISASEQWDFEWRVVGGKGRLEVEEMKKYKNKKVTCVGCKKKIIN